MSAAKPLAAAPVRRAFRLVFALQGQAFEGLRLKQLADLTHNSMPTTLRDLEVLADEGIVERVPGRQDFWRLSPKLIQVAIAHQDEMRRLDQRVSDFQQRYSRQP